MSKVFNMVGGGGGKNISSIVITGLESTDTVTCTKDGKSYTATWNETAQHWEIVGLPLGTFTITATNGTKTKTETVLIDITGVYEIEMAFKLWLYKDNDECVDVTGGWVFPSLLSTTGFDGYSNGTLTREKQESCIYIYCERPNGTGGYYSYGSTRTSNKIDLSGYSTLCLEYENCDFSTQQEDYNPRFGASETAQDGRKPIPVWSETYQEKIPSGSGTVSIDVSGVTSAMYVMVTAYVYGNLNNKSTVKIKRVWLE